MPIPEAALSPLAPALPTEGVPDSMGPFIHQLQGELDEIRRAVSVTALRAITEAEGNGGNGGPPGVTDHAELTSLDYSSSGHTGFATVGSVAAVAGDLSTHAALVADVHGATGSIIGEDDDADWTGVHTFAQTIEVTGGIGVQTAPVADSGIRVAMTPPSDVIDTYYGVHTTGTLTGTVSQTYHGANYTATWDGSYGGGAVYGGSFYGVHAASNHANVTGWRYGLVTALVIDGDNNTFASTGRLSGASSLAQLATSASGNTVNSPLSAFRGEVWIRGSNNTCAEVRVLDLKAQPYAGTNHAVTDWAYIGIEDIDKYSNAPAITNYYGIRIGDATDISTTINRAIQIDAQDGTDQGATKGNIYFAGGNWNTGHAQLGDAHLWYNSGTLYGKTSAPTSATDGTDIMGAAAGGDSFIAWAGL